MKKKGRRKMSIKSRRKMLLSGRGSRRIKGRTRSLSTVNQSLSRHVNHQKVLNNSPVVEVQDGIAVNLDYTNPQHLKWMED